MAQGHSLWALTPEGSTEARVGLKMGMNKARGGEGVGRIQSP